MKQIKLIALLMALPYLGFCQEKWEGGVFVGYSNYLGEMVKPTFTFKEPSPAFGIMLRNHVAPSLGLRLNLLYGKIKGDDANFTELAARGGTFESSLVELSLVGEYELFGKKRFSSTGAFTKTWSPYIFGGPGLTFFNPDTNFGATKPGPKLDEDKAGDYSTTALVIPVGGGIKFDINRKVNLGIEWGIRYAFTDYLDGMSFTGNPDKDDVTIFGGVVLGFRFGDKDSDDDGISDENDKCPTQPGPADLGGCPDRDGDGLADRDDGCPDEPGEQRLNGCPDSDGDGIANKMDDCPDQAGLRRFSGCPDTDNDGVIDKEDGCPTVAGIPAMNGCPDSDRDGITDAKDACPDQPGTAEHNGCPDSDNDGIADSKDRCPDTPGLKRFDGCPDSDGDGVDDTKDKCPLLAGPASNDGCPEIKAEDKAVLDLAMRDVQFQTGSSKLLPSSLLVLNQVAELLSRYPGYKLQIDGYTDDVGNDFANQQLSLNRAKACFDYLRSKGVDSPIMSYAGYGETNPIADNKTAQGRAKNRRVQFILAPK